MVKTKQITLHAIGNDENFNYYIFDKKQEIMEILAKILWEIFDAEFELSETRMKNGKYIDKKINVEKLIDIHWGDNVRQNHRIDLFFGNKKIFLTIHCNQRLRLKFNEALGAIVKMPKPIKFKKRKFKK